MCRTGGWAAGLQMAAISLERTHDVDATVRGFTGSSQIVSDYLMQEVITDLEPEVRRFLLLTSVLEWLTPELCDAVTGDHNGVEMLDLLDRRSLFVVHTEDHPDRTSYHDLFADLLRYQLRADDPSAERRRRLAAASWLLEHGQRADGIEQLLAAREPRRVADLITQFGPGVVRARGGGHAHAMARRRGGDGPRPAGVASAQPARRPVRRPRERGGDRDLQEAPAPPRPRARGGGGRRRAVRRPGDGRPPDHRGAQGRHRGPRPARGVRRGGVPNVLGLGGRDTIETIAATLRAVADLHDGLLAESAERFESLLDLPGTQYRIWKPYALGGLAITRALTGSVADAEALARATVDAAEANHVGHHHALTYAHFALALVAIERCEPNALIYHLHEAELRVRPHPPEGPRRRAAPPADRADRGDERSRPRRWTSSKPRSGSLRAPPS